MSWMPRAVQARLSAVELDEERVLLPAHLRDLPLVRGAERVQRVRVARGERGAPAGPGRPAVRLLERHEQRVVVEPAALQFAEVVVGVVGHELLEGLGQPPLACARMTRSKSTVWAGSVPVVPGMLMSSGLPAKAEKHW